MDANIKIQHALSVGVFSRMLTSVDEVGGGAGNDMSDGIADAADDSSSFIRGTYAGIDGQYRCIGTCNLTWQPDGSVQITKGRAVALMDHLIFQADDPSALLPDQDYLVFGTWLLSPDTPTTGNAGFVRVFANGNAPAFSAADINELNGTAAYNGDAVGHYATRGRPRHHGQRRPLYCHDDAYGRFQSDGFADWQAAVGDFGDCGRERGVDSGSGGTNHFGDVHC